MEKGKVVLALLFVLDTDFSEVVEPRMRDFHDPSPRFSVRVFPIRIILLFREIFTSWAYVGDVSGCNDSIVNFRSDIASIETKVLFSSFRSLCSPFVQKWGNHF